MSHETPVIEATVRDRTGSRYAQRLRKAGQLPGIIYGHGADPVAVAMNSKEILTHLHHGVHVMEVKLDSGQTETCLVKDLQFGYLGDNVIHIDLARVDLDEEVHVSVALNYKGEPEAAKEAGAIVNHELTQLEVICKVNVIPEEIVVDLSKMEGTSMNISEFELPAGVRHALDEGTTAVSIQIVAAVEDAGEGADVEATDGSEPEVITEAKEDEGGE